VEKKLSNLLRDYNSGGFIFLLLIAAILFTPNFFEGGNLLYLLTEMSMSGILAVGMTLLLLIGMFDMSVANQVSFLTLIAANAVNLGFLPCLVITLAAGLAVGAVNGVVTSVFKINALITTFGMMGILRGINLVISDAKSVLVTDVSLKALFRIQLAGIPICVVIFAVLVGAAHILLKYTRKGFEIYCFGGNADAARLSGINTKAVTIMNFMVMGFCSALFALLTVSRASTASPLMTSNITLVIITSCVIGGIKFNGGYGTIVNTILGVLIMQVISSLMYLTSTIGYVRSMIDGGILILVLIIDAFSTRWIKMGKFRKIA